MSIFFSLFLILVGGVFVTLAFKKIHLPSLAGLLLFGIFLRFLEERFGATSFHFIDPTIDLISPFLRKIALITILSKAGLSLNLSDLKKVGRPAILMSFLPATIEMCTIGVFAPLLFGISYVDSFLLGSVLGAVSPAVVVPMMSKLMDQHIGTEKGVPQLIVASSSIDDIVMIVFYEAFLTLEKGQAVSMMTFLNIPLSIVSGIALGILLGFLFSILFCKCHINDTFKLILLFGISFGLTYLEEIVSPYFGFSSLLAVIALCVFLNAKSKELASILVERYSKIWVIAEILLFVLIGACIKIEYAGMYFLLALALLAISLSFRSLAVTTCLIKTNLNFKERLFAVISFLPKATVQAAIGGGLLDYGNSLIAINASNANEVVRAGTIVLSVSVIAILVTAPLSAILMNFSYPYLLKKDDSV